MEGDPVAGLALVHEELGEGVDSLADVEVRRILLSLTLGLRLRLGDDEVRIEDDFLFEGALAPRLRFPFLLFDLSFDQFIG